MTLFDLLFIAVALASAAILCVVAGLALAGRGPTALRLLRAYGIGIALYLLLVAGSSLAMPREILAVGQDKCFDDWCIAVQSYDRSSSSSGFSYHVAVRISSTAKRVSQRENAVVVYLRDSRGRRFDAVPRASDVPFNSLLLPQQSLLTNRTFLLPTDAGGIGLVIAHEGGFQMGWLIIGEGPFHKDPVVPLQ